MKTTESNDTANLTSDDTQTPSTPDPHPSTCNPQPATDLDPSYTHRRNGKVAGLPKAVRDQINQMLDDGVCYAAIIEKLGESGKALSERAIGSWKGGGYQDWLKEQRLLAECRFRHELSLGLAGPDKGIDSFQAAQKVAADLIAEAVAESGADALRQAFKLNPLNLVRTLNSLSRISAAGLKCERHLADQADRKAQLEQQNATPTTPGLTTRTRRRIEQEFHLFPRPSRQYRTKRKRKTTSRAKSGPTTPIYT